MKTVGRFETPLEFVRRNGPTLTHEIGYRFGMKQDDALKIMKELEDNGEVVSRRASFHWGAGREWRVPTENEARLADSMLADYPDLSRAKALRMLIEAGA